MPLGLRRQPPILRWRVLEVLRLLRVHAHGVNFQEVIGAAFGGAVAQACLFSVRRCGAARSSAFLAFHLRLLRLELHNLEIEVGRGLPQESL